MIAWHAAGRRADATGCTWRPRAGWRSTDGAIPGGSSVPLTLDPAGLPADVRAQFPHLAAYERCGCPRRGARRARELLTGQLVVAAYDAGGRLVGATGVQIPGVLDDLYAERRARASSARPGTAGAPPLAVWAPTAKDVELCSTCGRAPSGASRCAAATTASGARRATPSWRDAAVRATR